MLSKRILWLKPDKKSDVESLGLLICHKQVQMDLARGNRWPNCTANSFTTLKQPPNRSMTWQGLICLLWGASSVTVHSKSWKGCLSDPRFTKLWTRTNCLQHWSVLTAWNLHHQKCCHNTVRRIASCTQWLTFPSHWSRLRGTMRCSTRNFLELWPHSSNWQHYLEEIPKRLEFIIWTNHCNLRSPITTKKPTSHRLYGERN